MLIGKAYHRRLHSSSAYLLLICIVIISTIAADAFTTMSATANKKIKLSNGDEDNTSSTLQPIRAGFIGCGTIASAIATSLAKPNHKQYLAQVGYTLQSISVTRRSESKSSKLKEDFDDVVTVYESAEEVVANSDLVFLCVLPQQVDSVLENLTKKSVWRTAEQTLVSLVVRIMVTILLYLLNTIITRTM